MVRPHAIWMISLSTPTPSPITGGSSVKSCPPSRSGGYFSSQRNASLSRRRSNTLDWSSQRPCGYGSDEGLWSHRMADPNKGQGGPVLPWLCELLLEVYLQLLHYCPPPLCNHLQDPAVGLGFTKAGGVRCPEDGFDLCPRPPLPFPLCLLLPQL